jgi:hypothetical protein
MDKPIINYGEEYTHHITTELLIKYLNKHSVDKVIDSLIYSIFYGDDLPELKTVKRRNEDKNKLNTELEKVLVFRNGEWLEEDFFKISLEIRKRIIDLALIKLTPKPEELSMEIYQKFLLYYTAFLEIYKKHYN